MGEASFDFLRGRIYRLARGLHPDSGPVPKLLVSVDGGAMSGLSTEIDGATLTIGGAEDCDVLLVDDGVSDAVVRLESRRSALGPLVHVSSTAQGVTANHSPVQIEGTWERLPCRVEIGGVPVRLSRAGLPTGPGPLGVAGLAVAGLAALAFVFAPRPEASLALAAAPVAAMADRDDAAAVAAMRADLEAANLAEHVSLDAIGAGGVAVAGTLPEARMDDWRDLRMAWDARDDLPPLMGRVEVLRGLDRLPPIAAIKLGAEAEVLMSDGRVVRPGDPLVDGWTLDAITAESLDLTRDGERIEMTF